MTWGLHAAKLRSGIVIRFVLAQPPPLSVASGSQCPHCKLLQVLHSSPLPSFRELRRRGKRGVPQHLGLL